MWRNFFGRGEGGCWLGLESEMYSGNCGKYCSSLSPSRRQLIPLCPVFFFSFLFLHLFL